MVRKAASDDIEQITNIYEAIHTEEEHGRVSTGWKRDVYPTRQTVEASVERGDMFVEIRQDQIVAAGIINQNQGPEYAECSWRYPADNTDVMVFHTLAVHPDAGGKGCAKEFIRFYETYAVHHGCHYLRLDTQEQNSKARNLYIGLGFQEAGIVNCVFHGISGVHLVCLEKAL